MARHHAQRGEQHGGIVGEAEERQHVGHEVEGHDEIGECADQGRSHLEWRCPIEGTVIGGEQVFGERQSRRHSRGLAPEIAPHPLLLGGDVLIRTPMPECQGRPERHRNTPSPQVTVAE
jgi:hypothetical protein